MESIHQADDLAVLNKASSMAPAEAAALAKSHIAGYLNQGATRDESRAMGLTARTNGAYREILETNPELAKLAKEAVTIGAPMPRAEWAQARDLAGANGRVYLPKILADYAGAIVMVTDNHVVQQAGKNSVTAHDLSKLENRDELARLNSEGKLQGTVVKIAYGSSEGRSEVLTLTQNCAAEISQKAHEYAEISIKTPQARSSFLKHVEQMMASEMDRGKVPATAAQQPARQQQRVQERSR